MNQVFFLHENRRPHEGGKCNSSSLQSRFSTLQLPSFDSLKDSLRGRRFADDDELKHSVREEFRPFSQELYAKRLMQSGKSLSIMNETLWKNNLNVVNDVPMVYIYIYIYIFKL